MVCYLVYLQKSEKMVT